MKPTPCKYCHQPTNRTYRNERKHRSCNLTTACKQCASSKPHLSISLIFTKSN